MKKLIPLLLAAALGGCFTAAVPAFSSAVEKTIDATMMIVIVDMQSGERRQVVCAPVSDVSNSTSTYK